MATSAKTRSGTTVDELCTALRERIASREYFPGQRMSQEQLAAEFKVSRTPLREAFKRLEADGLLVATANRGVHVAPISNSDTEQNYALRILIEPPIVATLTEQLTDTEIEQMQTALADMRKYRGHAELPEGTQGLPRRDPRPVPEVLGRSLRPQPVHHDPTGIRACTSPPQQEPGGLHRSGPGSDRRDRRGTAGTRPVGSWSSTSSTPRSAWCSTPTPTTNSTRCWSRSAAATSSSNTMRRAHIRAPGTRLLLAPARRRPAGTDHVEPHPHLRTRSRTQPEMRRGPRFDRGPLQCQPRLG